MSRRASIWSHLRGSRRPAAVRAAWIAACSTLAAALIAGLIALLAGSNHTDINIKLGIPSPSARSNRAEGIGQPGHNTVPVPAPSSSPPVQVESVTDLRSLAGIPSVALPSPLEMTSRALTRFNRIVVPNSLAYSAWYTKHSGAAVNFGVTTITLRGNSSQRVRISDMKVLKDCSQPWNGTYFQGYSQGTGNTVRIGFNLDSPNPIPQQLAMGPANIPLGVNFFDQEYIALAPGEAITLAIGAFTKHYACSFRLQMFVATPAGTLSEIIDDHGQPFRVTATVAPAHRGLPLSGYRAAYAYVAADGAEAGWKPVNPRTYKPGTQTH